LMLIIAAFLGGIVLMGIIVYLVSRKVDGF
jgi:hypothetical protein